MCFGLFQKREVNTTLADIIKHMTPDRAFEDFYPQLQSVVSKILVHMHDFSLLFSLVSLAGGLSMISWYHATTSLAKA